MRDVALDHRARIKKGEWLLVNGAGGGIGLAAVEIGKLLGARVIATAGSEEKLAIARNKGADFTLNYRHENIREKINKITDGNGVDIAFDPVGGDVLRQSIRAMAPEGRVLVVGFASGDIPKVLANYLLVKNITLIGYYWGVYKQFKQDVLQDSIAQLFEWYREGIITPHIGAQFQLEKTVDAIKLLRDRKSCGKVVVRI